jgi:hypothetical protein
MRVGSHRRSNGRKRVWWLLAVVGLCVAVVGAIAFATDVFDRGDSTERAAQERCESEVLKRLASPSTAKLSNVQIAQSDLDPDVKDLFSLTLNDPLKGVDHARITVWGMSGAVDAQSEVGSTIHQGFECRAYFVDGSLADTLVLLDHH